TLRPLRRFPYLYGPCFDPPCIQAQRDLPHVLYSHRNRRAAVSSARLNLSSKSGRHSLCGRSSVNPHRAASVAAILAAVRALCSVPPRFVVNWRNWFHFLNAWSLLMHPHMSCATTLRDESVAQDTPVRRLSFVKDAVLCYGDRIRPRLPLQDPGI